MKITGIPDWPEGGRPRARIPEAAGFRRLVVVGEAGREVELSEVTTAPAQIGVLQGQYAIHVGSFESEAVVALTRQELGQLVEAGRRALR